MSWVAVGVAAVGAVGGGISASQSNKKAKGALGGYDKVVEYARGKPGAFGKKLDWKNAEFTPLFDENGNYSQFAANTIQGNADNFGAAAGLSDQVNNWMTNSQQQRLNAFDPTFMDSYGQNAQNTSNMLNGVIPQEDMNGIISNRTQRQQLAGANPGGQQVAADLGLTRMGLMQQGSQQLGQNASIFNQLFPQGSYMRPDSMFVDVPAALNSAIQENQFGANFAANERTLAANAAAQPDPYQAGMLNLLASRAGMQAGMPQQSVAGGALAGGTSAYGGYITASGQLYGGQNTQPAGYSDPNWQPPQRRYASQANRSAQTPYGTGISGISNTGAYY